MAVKTFKLKGFKEKFFFMKENYSEGGGIAVTLMSLEKNYEDEFTTLSINMDSDPKDGFWVKNYGENTEVVRVLEEEGYLERTGQVINAGYERVPAMILTPKANNFLGE